MSDPGPLLGSGRSADVFDLGDGTVLRRYRQPRDTEREVAAMEHARAHGFPVPAARAAGDTDIVMERAEGPTMLDDLARRPWRLGAHAASLADLHRRLHRVEAPAWLPSPVGAGGALLHLDLHPDNVILTRAGPIVIDWPNAAAGPPGADVAHTWLVLACSLPLTGGYRQLASLAGRRLFTRLFLARFDRTELLSHLRAAGSYRLASRRLPAAELEALGRLLGRTEAQPR